MILNITKYYNNAGCNKQKISLAICHNINDYYIIIFVERIFMKFSIKSYITKKIKV